MIERELAIILRSFPSDDTTASVLTLQHGKIRLAFPRKGEHKSRIICPGSIVRGVLQRKKNTSWEILSPEVVWFAYTDQLKAFYSINHILELSYYFLPLEEPSPSLFKLLYHTLFLCSYFARTPETSSALRRMATAKFFVLLGFYPPHDLIKQVDIYDTILGTYVDLPRAEKVQFVADVCNQIPADTTTMLENWITACIEDHPCRKLFKTKRFLDSGLKNK